jgi:hypothetical protein
VLAAAYRSYFPWMAALLRWRALGLFRLRMVLAVRLLVGLGAIPLWPLADAPPLRVGLGARPNVGPGVGDVASRRR